MPLALVFRYVLTQKRIDHATTIAVLGIAVDDTTEDLTLMTPQFMATLLCAVLLRKLLAASAVTIQHAPAEAFPCACLAAWIFKV